MPRVIVLTDGGREVAGFKAYIDDWASNAGLGFVNDDALTALDQAVAAAERAQAEIDGATPTSVAQLEPGDRVWVDAGNGRADWSTFSHRTPGMNLYRVHFLDGPLNHQDYPADAQVAVRRG